MSELHAPSHIHPFSRKRFIASLLDAEVLSLDRLPGSGDRDRACFEPKCQLDAREATPCAQANRPTTRDRAEPLHPTIAIAPT